MLYLNAYATEEYVDKKDLIKDISTAGEIDIETLENGIYYLGEHHSSCTKIYKIANYTEKEYLVGYNDKYIYPYIIVYKRTTDTYTQWNITELGRSLDVVITNTVTLMNGTKWISIKTSVRDYLSKKQDVLTGTSGQIIGFDADGNAIAQDMPTSLPTVTTEDAGKVLCVSDEGTWSLDIMTTTGVDNSKQDKLTGDIGQLVGFDSEGNAVAQDKPTYTADEVGAATTAYVDEKIAAISAPDLSSKQDKITGTAGQFVVIGEDGNITTKTIPSATGVSF